MEAFICSACKNEIKRTWTDRTWKVGTRKQRVWIDENGISCTGLICTPCRYNKRSKVYHHVRDANQRTRDYRKTLKGFVVHSYVNLRKRCAGEQERTRAIYQGLPYPSKEEFYLWCESREDLKRLHEAYKINGWRRRFAPSLDRIDSKGGYTFDNMQWLTNAENISKSHRDLGRPRRGFRKPRIRHRK